MTRDQLNALGDMLRGLREDGDGRLLVSIGVFGPDTDSTIGSLQVTIQRGPDEVTGHAVSLGDAMFLARANVVALDAKREAERVEAVKAKLKGPRA